MMDFVNYDPYINEFLIGLNFPYKLKIHEGYALVGKLKVDLIENLRQLVSRENSLWIISMDKDLGIVSRHAELHIVYEYEPNRLVHKKVYI